MYTKNKSYHRVAGSILLLVALTAGIIALTGHDDAGMATERRLQGNSQGNQGLGGSQGLGRPNADGSCGPGKNPVCVDGEITYQTACLAQAQGNMIYTNGPCSGKVLAQFQGDGAATAAEMSRFESEGFKLVGKVKIVDAPPPEYTVVDDGKSPSNDAPDQLQTAIRVTIDGFEYATMEPIPWGVPTAESPNAESPNAESPTDLVAPEDGGGRSLAIIMDPSDLRIKQVWPYASNYWKIGEADWGGGEGGCTGTVIGTNKVLIAAHCVYNTYTNVWTLPSWFAPARYRSGSTTIEPFGRWPVVTAGIVSGFSSAVLPCNNCMTFAATSFDFAVLTLGKNAAVQSIGDQVGTLPIIVAPCTVSSWSTTAGYPGDKPDGELYSSWLCATWGSGCPSNRVISSSCDVFVTGSSGSPVFHQSQWQVFGVASAIQMPGVSYFFGFNQLLQQMAYIL